MDRLRATNTNRKLGQRWRPSLDHILAFVILDPAGEMDTPTLSEYLSDNKCGLD